MSERPSDRKTPKGVKIPLGQRRSGLTVPADVVDVCRHEEVVKRIPAQTNQYVCGGCSEKLLFIILQAALMTSKEFVEFKAAQVLAATAAKRKQETGLVLPDEARREQQEKRR